MRRIWPAVTIVAVVGLMSGAAIAGRPTERDPFKIDIDNPPSTTTSIAADTGTVVP